MRGGLGNVAVNPVIFSVGCGLWERYFSALHGADVSGTVPSNKSWPGMSYWPKFVLQRWSPPQDVCAFVMLLMLAKRNEGRTVGTDAAKSDRNDAIGTAT